MKITFTGGTGINAVVLCGATRKEDPFNLKVRHSIQVQEATILRGVGQLQFDRKNKRTQINFDVRKQATSYRAAETAVMEAASLGQKRGLLTIEMGDSFTGTSKKYLINAVISEILAEHFGVSYILSYTIIGGAMSTTAT